MKRMVKTMDDAYKFIERFADRYDSYKINVKTDEIEVTMWNKEG